MEYLAVLLLAIAWDLGLGEPPAALHPVVWMGKVIGILEAWCPTQKTAALAYGTLMTLLVVVSFAGGGLLLLSWLREASLVLYIVVAAYLLKSSFSLRGLYQAGARMRDSLSQKGLVAARDDVRALVSRDAGSLDEPHLVSATVESLSENITDSLVAPVLFFVAFGIPGALAYRAVNTLDAMVGYRGRYEYLGKFAARLDDVLNLVPARLAALAVVAGAFLARANVRDAWRMMCRDGGKTESPNAGWTMAAAAGALGLQLEKIGHYRLGESVSALAVDRISMMLSILAWSAALWLTVCLAVEALVAAL